MDKRRVRKINLIDMDVFYASFEQLNNPDLKSWPVASAIQRAGARPAEDSMYTLQRAAVER